MDNSVSYRLADALFAWEKEITVPLLVTDGSAEFNTHYVNVPIGAINRDFCFNFSNVDTQLEVLRRIQIERINSLCTPLESVSIVPLFGFQKSREIEKITGDFTLFSFLKLSNHPRHSFELAPFWEGIIGSGFSWLRHLDPWNYWNDAPHSDQGVKNPRDLYVEYYLRLWRKLTENPFSESLLKNAGDMENFNLEALRNLTSHQKVDVLDDWLQVCSTRTRALFRLRNGLTPNFRYRCTQELVGRFLNLTQAAISHLEREQFDKRSYTFCRYLMRRFHNE